MSDKNKKRSSVWNFFDERGLNQAKCNFCSKILSYKGGATGNLIRHLKTVHPTVQLNAETSTSLYSGALPQGPLGETGSFASTSTEVSASAQRQIREGVEKITPLPTRINIGPGRFGQTTIESFTMRPLSDKKTNELHNSLVKLLVKNYLPIHLVDDEHFRTFVKALNSNYQVPSRKTVSNTLIPQLMHLTQEKVRNSLQPAIACCITTDGWTSCVNTSFISVTAHYIVNSEMKSSLLDCYEYNERHTAENLCNELQRVVREWNMEKKIVAVASDNAANISAAIKLTGWNHVPCFAHNLNLIVQSSLLAVIEMQTKVKKIVEFFKRSTQASAKLRAMQIQLGTSVLTLKQDCVTRWNSTYEMFRRILEVKQSLMSVIAINYPKVSNLNNNDILILEAVCDVLKMFKDVTEEMSTEKQITASKVILLSSALRKHCLNFLESNSAAPLEVQELGTKLLENLGKRFQSVEENKLFAEATLLDPRFKRHGFTNEALFDRAKQSLIVQVTTHITQENITKTQNNAECNLENSQSQNTPQKETMDHWSEFDNKVSSFIQNTDPKATAIIEVNKFLEEPLQPRADDPLGWWNQRRYTYPNLYELSKKKLCVVATSVPSERVFSKAGHVLTDLRNRLTGKRVSQILFLNANL